MSDLTDADCDVCCYVARIPNATSGSGLFCNVWSAVIPANVTGCDAFVRAPRVDQTLDIIDAVADGPKLPAQFCAATWGAATCCYPVDHVGDNHYDRTLDVSWPRERVAPGPSPAFTEAVQRIVRDEMRAMGLPCPRPGSSKG